MTENTGIVKGQNYVGHEHEWVLPEDVAAALNLCGFMLYGPAKATDKSDTYPKSDTYAYFLDVWDRKEFEGDCNEWKGRMFDSDWVNTAEEALKTVVEWVRAGMPDGFGEATGKEK